MSKITTALLALLVLATAGAARADDAEADKILGMWMTELKDAIVEVYKVDDKFHGKIVWIIQPLEADGSGPDLDNNNPVDTLKTQPVVGLELMQGFEYQGNGAYRNGSVYDPANGKTYGGTMVLEGDDDLKLRGYVGVPLFGRNSFWTRHTGDFPPHDPPPEPPAGT